MRRRFVLDPPRRHQLQVARCNFLHNIGQHRLIAVPVGHDGGHEPVGAYLEHSECMQIIPAVEWLLSGL